jgi:hypothetical protein
MWAVLDPQNKRALKSAGTAQIGCFKAACKVAYARLVSACKESIKSCLLHC